MKKYLTITLSLLIACTALAQDKRLKNVDKDLNALLKSTKVPGFAVAVVENDKVIYARGFGYRDYENKTPVDANTLFAIGSSSKAFTCSILGLLKSEGKLAFSDSPLKYVPGLKFYNNDLNNDIIIEDLMSHRTGLPRHDWSWYFFPTHDKDSRVQRIQYQEPFTGLRQQWHYNNFMFLVQGVIAEKITGKSWEDNIRERFLVPLEMNRTNVSIAEMKEASNAAFGYELDDKGGLSKMDYYDIAAMAPAGSINSSANDMANWLITWIGKGKFKGKEIIPESYITEAMSSHAVVHGGLPGKEMPNTFLANYGYGWFLSSYKGNYRVEHGGNIDGFSASVVLFPASDIGIVVLVNENNSSVPSLVRNTIADRLLDVKKTDWNAKYLEEEKKSKETEKPAKKAEEPVNNTPSHPLDSYTGLFTNPGYGTFEIVRQSDSLFANFKHLRFFLKHKHYDVFSPYDATEAEIDTSEDTDGLFMNFTTNDAGEIASVKLKAEQTLDHPIEFKRKPKEVAVAVDVVNAYVGSYEISGMEVKVYVKNEKLYLFVPGQPEYELTPVSKNMYVITALDGFKVEFVSGNDGKVKEIVLHQPNGTFSAARK